MPISRAPSRPYALDRLFQDLVEASQDLIWQCDAEARYTYLNPAWEATFGYALSEMIGKRFTDFQAPDEAKRALDLFAATLRGESVKGYETVHVGKSGNSIPLIFNATPVRDEVGSIIGSRGSAHDITERKLTEEKLRESEAHYRFISENAEDVIWTLSLATGKFTYLSPSVERLRGYTAEEGMAQTMADVLTPDSLDRTMKLLEQSIAERRPGDASLSKFIGQLDQRRKDGSIVPTEVVVSLTFDAQGHPRELIGITRDITERKLAENEAAAEKERLATTLRSIGDGVITTDVFGNIVALNKVAEELTGWTEQESRGQPLCSIFNIIHESTRAPCENPVEKVLASGRVVELANHTLLVARNGCERVIADSGAPIKDKADKTIGVVLVFRDVTEKQKLLDAVQRADKLDALGVLAGGIAHDFNNLLAGLFGYIDLARRSADGNPDTTELLDEAISAFGRAKDLTRQLLTFSKGGEPIRRAGQVAPTIMESAKFALSGSSILCEFHVAENLPPCDFDRNQIGQVIDNLVINAQQAMPDGGRLTIIADEVLLDGRTIPTLPAGRYVRVAIADTGVGVQPGLLNKIFDPFFTTKPQGSGLGLATCYSIMRKHNGTIEVKSELGKGSTFTLFLPCSESTSTVESPGSQSQHSGKGTALVLDDQEPVRNMIARMLATMGYTVMKARSGEELLAEVARVEAHDSPIACAILDLTIPGGMGGQQVLAELKKKHPDLPGFATSGYSEDPVIAKPEDYGFAGSLRKPFLYSDLAQLLNAHLKQS